MIYLLVTACCPYVNDSYECFQPAGLFSGRKSPTSRIVWLLQPATTWIFNFPSWSIVEAGIASRKPQSPNRRSEFLRLDDDRVVAAVVCLGAFWGPIELSFHQHEE